MAEVLMIHVKTVEMWVRIGFALSLGAYLSNAVAMSRGTCSITRKLIQTMDTLLPFLFQISHTGAMRAILMLSILSVTKWSISTKKSSAEMQQLKTFKGIKKTMTTFKSLNKKKLINNKKRNRNNRKLKSFNKRDQGQTLNN